MKEQLKISLVRYLNSTPYDYGLEVLRKSGQVQVVRDHPKKCAERLQSKEVDLGLVPVAALADQRSHYRVPGWGIGCTGHVESVCLLSKQELDKVRSVFLDPESRTSNLLVRILMEEYLELEVTYKKRDVPRGHYDDDGSHAYLVIGDQALRDRTKFRCCHDLGDMWYQWQGLPFVFAVWAGPCQLSLENIEMLHDCFEQGIARIPEIVRELREQFPHVDVAKYLTESIDHRLSQEHEEGLSKFLQKVNAIGKQRILI